MVFGRHPCLLASTSRTRNKSIQHPSTLSPRRLAQRQSIRGQDPVLGSKCTRAHTHSETAGVPPATTARCTTTATRQLSRSRLVCAFYYTLRDTRPAYGTCRSRIFDRAGDIGRFCSRCSTRARSSFTGIPSRQQPLSNVPWRSLTAHAEYYKGRARYAPSADRTFSAHLSSTPRHPISIITPFPSTRNLAATTGTH